MILEWFVMIEKGMTLYAVKDCWKTVGQSCHCIGVRSDAVSSGSPTAIFNNPQRRALRARSGHAVAHSLSQHIISELGLSVARGQEARCSSPPTNLPIRVPTDPVPEVFGPHRMSEVAVMPPISARLRVRHPFAVCLFHETRARTGAGR